MKVSVIVTSYNHEQYISQALDSILKQDFSDFEIIIGDDCSTDKTPLIIDEYAKNNPDKMIVLKDSNNLGITKNLERCFIRCSGEYVAVCEGDDYWIDDKKLEKQVRFLDINKNCSMCFNKINFFYQADKKLITHPLHEKLDDKSFLTIKDLIYDNYIGNFSCCMYRKDALDSLDKSIFNFYTVDWMINMAVSEKGVVGFIDELMSVYRIHNNGAWSGVDEEKKLLSLIESINTYDIFFNSKYCNEFSNLKKRVYKSLWKTSLRRLDIMNFLFYGLKTVI